MKRSKRHCGLLTDCPSIRRRRKGLYRYRHQKQRRGIRELQLEREIWQAANSIIQTCVSQPVALGGTVTDLGAYYCDHSFGNVSITLSPLFGRVHDRLWLTAHIEISGIEGLLTVTVSSYDSSRVRCIDPPATGPIRVPSYGSCNSILEPMPWDKRVMTFGDHPPPIGALVELLPKTFSSRKS